VTESTLLASCVRQSRKVHKLELEEVIIDLNYVHALNKVFDLSSQSEELTADGKKKGIEDQGPADTPKDLVYS